MPLNVVFATNFSSLEYKYFRCKAGESAVGGGGGGGGGGKMMKCSLYPSCTIGMNDYFQIA